ncbi:MAG: YceI family protein [Gemmatimonadota bacterium]
MYGVLFAALLAAVPVPSPRVADSAVAARPPATWRIDVTHSELTFRIRHLVSRVRGTFRQWSGSITADSANWDNGAVQVTIQTASIFTDNERRDNHLRSPDFFAADSFPTITFQSTRVSRSGDDLRIEGTLTMRGVSRPVVLTGSFTGFTRSAEGEVRVGFAARTRVNRLDYGVQWNRAVEGGGVLLGDDVDIEIAVEAIRQP